MTYSAIDVFIQSIFVIDYGLYSLYANQPMNDKILRPWKPSILIMNSSTFVLYITTYYNYCLQYQNMQQWEDKVRPVPRLSYVFYFWPDNFIICIASAGVCVGAATWRITQDQMVRLSVSSPV